MLIDYVISDVFLCIYNHIIWWSLLNFEISFKLKTKNYLTIISWGRANLRVKFQKEESDKYCAKILYTKNIKIKTRRELFTKFEMMEGYAYCRCRLQIHTNESIWSTNSDGAMLFAVLHICQGPHTSRINIYSLNCRRLVEKTWNPIEQLLVTICWIPLSVLERERVQVTVSVVIKMSNGIRFKQTNLSISKKKKKQTNLL